MTLEQAKEKIAAGTVYKRWQNVFDELSGNHEYEDLLESAAKLLESELSSKEQECEELKKGLAGYSKEVLELQKIASDQDSELASLRAENERLKKIIESDKETHDRAEYSLRKRCEDLEAAMKCNSAVLSRAFDVGEIRFKTCVLSASVHDNIVEVMKLNKELLSQ